MMTGDAQQAAEQFTRCWTESQQAVAAYVSAFVVDFHDRQEIVQNVAVVALRKFAKYDAERPFVQWVLGIARFEVLNHFRRSARNPLLTEEEIANQIAVACEEMSDEFERRSRVLTECLGLLDNRAAEMVRLRYEEALKPASISERLGMGGVAVRVALNRIRASLRRCIERKLKHQTS